MIDFGAIFGKMFAPIGAFFGLLFKCVFGGALLLIFGALVISLSGTNSIP